MDQCIQWGLSPRLLDLWDRCLHLVQWHPCWLLYLAIQWDLNVRLVQWHLCCLQYQQHLLGQNVRLDQWHLCLLLCLADQLGRLHLLDQSGLWRLWYQCLVCPLVLWHQWHQWHPPQLGLNCRSGLWHL